MTFVHRTNCEHSIGKSPHTREHTMFDFVRVEEKEGRYYEFDSPECMD